MVRKRQYRLHHVQVVDSDRIDRRQGGRKQVCLFLVVALDGHAIARCDDRLEQRGCALRRTDLGARVAHGPQPRATFVRAVARCMVVVRHDGSSCAAGRRCVAASRQRMGTQH